jgi:glycine/D-amino acid oxidase-like deaminating enzyme
LRGFIPPEFSGGTGQLQRTEILVVGAGPAGLTTAYMLAKAGRDVTVIERDPIMLAASVALSITRAFFSTSAAIASSRNRRKSSRYGRNPPR